MEVGFKRSSMPPQVTWRHGPRSQAGDCQAVPALPCQGGRRASRRAAFSLIEMLIVIAIVGLIMALSVGAFMMAPRQARARGTEALIAKIEAKLDVQLNEFNRGRANILANLTIDTPLSGVPANGSRARVIAAMRTMRQTFPEMFYIDMSRASDGINNDGDSSPNEADEVIAGQWNPLDRNFDGLPDQKGVELPAAAVTYLRYMEANLLRSPTFLASHTPGTARAECLYMIVTKCGADAGDFSADETRDTDGDGLPEFVDKFGNPIQFFLWPSYYGADSLVAPFKSISPKQNPGAETDPDDPNQLLTQADWWNASAPVPPPRPVFERLFHTLTHFVPQAGIWQPKGFRTYPLIVSAGPDEGFGFRGDPAFVGGDGVMGTLDDTDPSGSTQLRLPAIGLMLSVGPDGTIGTADDGNPALATGPAVLRQLRISAAMRILDPSVDGYGQDSDNIDNHRLRAR